MCFFILKSIYLKNMCNSLTNNTKTSLTATAVVSVLGTTTTTTTTPFGV